ncbi:hypothetical protein L6452_14819 [Arctium lappa]|uniref:Uncharacterized protein n=1 Tax=Arctium lappa TaxID=4217 RepID=A0ACB9CM12_ARCLA|nr:hypothetical protein L6452_14819 [Arctium lappa]
MLFPLNLLHLKRFISNFEVENRGTIADDMFPLFDKFAEDESVAVAVERWRMVSVAGNVGGGFAAAGEDGDDGWIDRDEILQVAKEKEKELMVEMINVPKKIP